MSRLRVMTLNLWGPQVDLDALDTVLARISPDVLAVQELEAPAAGVIARRFPHHELDPGFDALGSGVASTRPAGFGRVEMAHRHGWSVRLRPEGWDTDLEMVSAHLMNPISWPWWRSVARRRSQVAAVAAHIDGGEHPTVLVGDMNATPRWPAYRRLAALPDIEDAAVLAGSAAPTWRWRGIGPPMLRIDHVFVRRLRVSAVTTVAVAGSDHLAVVADVEPAPAT